MEERRPDSEFVNGLCLKVEEWGLHRPAAAGRGRIRSLQRRHGASLVLLLYHVYIRRSRALAL